MGRLKRFCVIFLVGSVPLFAQNAATVPDLLKDAFARPALGLDVFNGMALANNPTLQQSTALVNRSAGQAKQAGLWPNPSAGYQGEQIRGGDYGGGEQGAFVQQTFVLGGKLGLRRNVYEQQRRAEQIGVTEQRTRILSNVGQQFYASLAAQETVKLRQQLLGIATDAVQTARQLQNVGQADAPDVLQAEVEAEQAALEYTTAQRVYIQEFRTLAALTGKVDLPLSPLAGDLEHPPQITPEEISEQILRDSPTLKRARQEVAGAEAALKSAKRESVPDLSLRAGLQQNYQHLPEDSARAVGVQGFATAGIMLPIFNRNQGNVTAASAELERARGEVTRLELVLRQSIQTLLQSYMAHHSQAERYREQMIPRAQRAYELYLNKYSNMASAYPQVIVSQRTLFQLRVAYLQVLQNLWGEAIALQNFTLSDGLNARLSSGSNSTEINLPSASGVAVQ